MENFQLWKKINNQESPVATRINSFEKEGSNLNQLAQCDSIPREGLDYMMGAFQSSSKPFLKQDSFTSRHKKVNAATKTRKPLMQTNKNPNRNSTGTKKLDRFLECPNTKNNNNNTSSSKNSLSAYKQNNAESKRFKKSTSSEEKSFSSSKITHTRDTLFHYFKKSKTVGRSKGKVYSPRNSGSVLHVNNFFKEESSHSISKINNVSHGSEDSRDCARTRAWPGASLAIWIKERGRDSNKGYKTMVKNDEKEYSSPLLKGLNFIEEFDQEYEKQSNKNGIPQAERSNIYRKVSLSSKAQNNLYSSEGFYESMSMESRIVEEEAPNKRKNWSSSSSCKNDSDSSKESNFNQICSANNSRKKILTTKYDGKLTTKPHRKRLTLSEERELSPDFYVMKMCGPESAKLVKSILNSHKNVDGKRKNSLSKHAEKSEEKKLENLMDLRKSFDEQKPTSQNKFSEKQFSLIRPEKCVANKNSQSDPLSFGSMTSFENVNFSQVKRKLEGFEYVDKQEIPKFLSPPLLDEITKNENFKSGNQVLLNNHNLYQKKDRLSSQALENVYKIHKGNSCNAPEINRGRENLKNDRSINKNYGATSEVYYLPEDNECKQYGVTIKDLTSTQPFKISNDAPFSNSIFNTNSSDIFPTQDNENIFQISKFTGNAQQTKNNESFLFKNNISFCVPNSEDADKTGSNYCDLFLQKLLTPNFEKASNDNFFNFKPEDSKIRISKENIQNAQINVYQPRENCGEGQIGDYHNHTNYEELRQIQTRIYSENFIERMFGSPIESQNISKKSKKTYNITEDCVLYGNNLLKSLIAEKENIWKESGRERVLMRKYIKNPIKNERCYIKRYRKGETKIFKIKRRIKKSDESNYEPPEVPIMDLSNKGLSKNFNGESSSNSESLNLSHDLQSVSTPTSYKTDETKSEVLSTGSSKLTKAQKLLRQGINALSKDKSLLFSKFEDSLPDNFNKYEIISNIEHIINRVLEDFKQGKPLFFIVPKENISNCIFLDGRYQMKQPPDYTTISYHASNSRQKFNLILFLLNKIKKLLESDTKLTKREIYYQLKTMINAQDTTDRALKDISKMLNVGLWALNVTAQKGLVYGSLKLVMTDGETLNCNIPGTSIPHDISKICEIQSTACFILVVEKESIFHKLLEENLPNKLTRPFILITGKGFPDLNTQLFLKKLWMVMSIPVFILVDADPDGITIMLNYRFGSIANAHVSEHLAIPKAKWLGVFPSELLKLNLPEQTLSKREIHRTRKLLELRSVQENKNIKSELEKLLENGVKAGIEGLIKTDTYLSDWYLSWKLFTNSLI